MECFEPLYKPNLQPFCGTCGSDDYKSNAGKSYITHEKGCKNMGKAICPPPWMTKKSTGGRRKSRKTKKARRSRRRKTRRN
jgi:hypothetical protein